MGGFFLLIGKMWDRWPTSEKRERIDRGVNRLTQKDRQPRQPQPLCLIPKKVILLRRTRPQRKRSTREVQLRVLQHGEEIAEHPRRGINIVAPGRLVFGQEQDEEVGGRVGRGARVGEEVGGVGC